MKKKYVFWFIVFLIVLGGFFFFKWVNKPVIDMTEAVCKSRLSAVELFDAYSNQQPYADSCYSGQVIEVFGKIKSMSTDGPNKSLLLETNDMLFGIDCAIDSTHHNKLNSLKEGQDINIRGECSGLLSDVVMVRCIIL
ncbi:MAG: OB-fold protein [Bacteroidota bacterium]|jgi:hypothetical protein